MTKFPLTVIIPVKNEERNIEKCLTSVAWCQEIIVVSMGDDATAKLAKKHGALVFERHQQDADNFLALQDNVNFAIDQASCNWILRLDADEEMTDKLQLEIIRTLSQTELEAFGVPRRQYFFGGFLKGGDWAFDRLVRIFKKGKARYNKNNLVHEQLVVSGKIGYLNESLLHYSHPSLETALSKFNTYTSLEARDLTDSYYVALFKLFTQPPYIFLRWMFWHWGIRDGLRGVVAASFRAFYSFLLYAKYLEGFKKHHISSDRPQSSS
ncbi:glycosyltransferase family 2 protein [Candidatus Roizmanbacteria bacterium]|nr:glycosyltransferase family 2 protein [Candidatus Roizmanbacteria bacterium]